MLQKSQTRGGRLLLAAVFALAVFMLFAGLGVPPLAQPDEGRNAEVAREMYESGSWVVPTLDGLAYLDKPAFFFKCSALCFSAFGVSEAAARLPSALFALATIAVAWAFARRAHGGRVAAFAVAIIATSPMFVGMARIVIMDMTLAFFVVAAIFAGAMAEEFDGRRRTWWLVAGSAASGFATLVKGPVGFIVPLVVLIPWHLLERRPGAIKRMLGWRPMLAFWVTVLPWFIGLSIARPDFPHYGLINESFNRFTSGSMKRVRPFHFFLPIIAGGFAVWSLLLPEGIIAAWRARSRLTRFDRLCVTWCVAVVVFFSLSKSKQPAYILSIAVPLGILVARLFDGAISDPRGHAARIVRRMAALLSMASIATAAIFAFVPIETLGRWFGESPEEMALVMPPVGPLCSSLLAVGVLGLVAAVRRKATLAYAAFVLILPIAGVCGFRDFEDYFSLRSGKIAAAELAKLPPGTQIACLGTYPSALPFYLRRNITLITADGDETGSNYIVYTLRKSDPWPPQMVKMSGFEQWLDARTNSIFLVASPKHRKKFEAVTAASGAETVQLQERLFGALFPAK